MKLIKKGNLLQRQWRGTCGQCGSEFEATREEVQGRIISDQWDDDFSPAVCTECDSRFYLYPVNH